MNTTTTPNPSHHEPEKPPSQPSEYQSRRHNAEFLRHGPPIRTKTSLAGSADGPVQSVSEVAAILRLSRQAVHQIERRAFYNIRRAIAAEARELGFNIFNRANA
jgi:hypothetical protein